MQKSAKKIIISIIILSFASLMAPTSALALSVQGCPATNITQTSATLCGSFDVSGNREFDTWFTIWDATAGVLTTTPKEKHSKGTITKFVSGLSANRQYDYLFWFERDGTEHSSSRVYFTTLPTPVAPTTNEASNITTVTAKLKGSWTTAVGNSATVWFEYSKNPSLTGGATTAQQNLGGSGSVIQTIANLELNTTYYFRIVTKNRAGTYYGEIKNFKTLETEPTGIIVNNEIPFLATITTDKADNISDIEAKLYLTATQDSSFPTTAYFRYTDTLIPPVFCNDIYGNDMISTGDIPISGTQSFSSKIFNLNPDTTYHYCAIVSSKNGINYGEVKEFHTPPEKPTITTIDATDISSTSVYLKGSYSSTKKIKTYFEYKKETLTSSNQEPPSWTKIGSSVQSHDANSYGDIGFLLSGLRAGTKYNFHLVAETIAETIEDVPETFYGYPSLSFTTNSAGPVVINGGLGLEFIPEKKPIELNKEPNIINEFTGGSDVIPGGGETGTGTGGTGTGTGTAPTIGQSATPPADALVHYREGIETVFVRQIIANKNLAKTYGYVEGSDLEAFAWNLADLFARIFGYVAENGKEIRVSPPDMAAYRLLFVGNKLTVYEYFNSRIVNIQSMTETLRNVYGYEYYFKK